MVDLVKIRKKSKDAKESGAAPVGDSRPIALPIAPSASVTSEPAVEAQATLEEPVGAEPAPREVRRVAPEPLAAPPPAPAATKKKPEPTASPAASKKASPPTPELPAAAAGAEPPPVAQPDVAEPSSEIDEAIEDRLARFKRLAGKRRSWTASPKPSEQAAAEEEVRTGLELLRFRVAGEDYAVDIEKIVEIVPPRPATRVPNADESIIGIISLRGTIVTVIDLRRKLGHPKVDLQSLKDARMIVVERAGETAGFLVDLVSRVVKLDPSELENHPVVSSAEQSEYVSGVFQSPDGLVILLDIERILAG
ncbi:MAG: chemotaxis protein CheW [Thermoanaerobaculia bacterium]